jgi:hypothetical protein
MSFSAKIAQGLLALAADVVRLVGVLGSALVPSDLRGNGDLVAARGESFGQHALGLAVAVDVGIVEVIHSVIERVMHRADGVGLIDLGPADGLAVGPVRAAEGPTAQAHLRDFDVGSAEFPASHDVLRAGVVLASCRFAAVASTRVALSACRGGRLVM